MASAIMIEKHPRTIVALHALWRTPRVSLRRLAGGTGLALTLLTGCAGATPTSETTPSATIDDDLAIERRTGREQRVAHAARVRELEAQLAMARAEVAELRGQSGGAVHTETVRIGGEDANGSASLFDDDDTGDWEVPAEHLPEAEDSGPQARREVLRLYGERSADPEPVLGDPSFAPVAHADVRAPELRLATAPVAAAPDPSAPPWMASSDGQAATSAGPTVDSAREAYERALGLFRERRVAEAARELQGMLASYPGHGLASRARYWLAESLYIQRRYDDARRSFEGYLVAAPRGAKAPDALLKIGLCHRRAGDDVAASRAFARLRTEHPNSVAARTAGRSDS